jgi:lambda family phage portal protein
MKRSAAKPGRRSHPAAPAGAALHASAAPGQASHHQQAVAAAVYAAQQLMGTTPAIPAAPQPATTNGVTIGAYTGEHGVGGNAPLRRHIWAPMARDANADTLRTLGVQRAQCRELARTHPVAIGALGTYLDRVIGTGLALVASPDRNVLGWSAQQQQEWKRHVQAEFSLWADSTDCDITGGQNFYSLQRLVAGARAESGDCFTLLPDGQRSAMMPYALRLQVIEADRAGNPGGNADTNSIAGGIQLDPNGRPLAAHIYNIHPGNYLATGNRYAGQWIAYTGKTGRRHLLHHWQPTRPGQTRGVPWFAPIIAILKDLDTYTDAEIKAAVVSAFFTVFITSASGHPAPVFGLEPQAAAADPTIAMGPAAVVGLAHGEDAKFADPNRPNTAFGPFVEQILAQVGMALSIPVELLLKRFNASYSASRAALLDAWMYFRTQRAWLARSFCQPVYETWLAEAVATNRVQAPGFFTDPRLRWAYTRASWHGDSQGSINPKDEVAAYSAAVDARLMSRERAEWELFGTDWHETTPQKIAEHQVLDAAGILPVPKAGAPAPQPAPAPAPAT